MAIVYHFFAHYRAPILSTLSNDSQYDYVFIGDDRDCFDSGIKIWQPDERSNFHRIRSISLTRNRILVQPQIFKLISQRDIDSVIFLGNPKILTTWLAATWARLLNKRVLFWTHGWYSSEHTLKNYLSSWFFRIPHALLLYGNRAKQIGIENGFDSERLYVIYNSLNYCLQEKLRESITNDELQELSQSLFGSPPADYFICLGRLQLIKEFDLVIDAMSKLPKRQIAPRLLYVGDGPEKERLEEKAERLGVNVQFYGACYDELTLAKLIMGAVATVSPGNVGLTAMHSLAYGTPVITHSKPAKQMPEFEAIIDGQTGSLFEYGNVADLAAKMQRWLEQDKEELEQAKVLCYQTIEKYYNPLFQANEIDHAIQGIKPSTKEEPPTLMGGSLSVGIAAD